jgi:transcriptional regulator with XRE-family HTH domain
MTIKELITFPEALRAYRTAMGWTQEEIARQWNYSFETISAWERGKRNPNTHEVPRLAKLLGMESEALAQSINTNRHKVQRSQDAYTDEARREWTKAFDIWGEIQGIYRSRTEFNRDFSYPRLFENATHILAVGISLNAIALNYSREQIIESIIEHKRTYQLCFLDPNGTKCAEREQEEGYIQGTLRDLTRLNMHHIQIIQNYLHKIKPDYLQYLQMRVYNLLPRLNIYIIDETFMTVQCYAYGRGEDTPTFVLKRQSNNGLFDFYTRAAKHVLEQTKPIEHEE